MLLDSLLSEVKDSRSDESLLTYMYLMVSHVHSRTNTYLHPRCQLGARRQSDVSRISFFSMLTTSNASLSGPKRSDRPLPPQLEGLQYQRVQFPAPMRLLRGTSRRPVQNNLPIPPKQHENPHFHPSTRPDARVQAVAPPVLRSEK